MPTYTRRVTSVEANQYSGPNLNITSFKAGDQVAHSGDFIVVDAEGYAASGGTNPKGYVYVIPKAEFLKEFNATDSTVTPTLESDPAFTFATFAPKAPAKA